MAFGLAALFLLAGPSSASWWVQDEATFGSRDDYVGNSFRFLGQNRRGWGLQAGHHVYSRDGVGATPHSLSLGLSRLSPTSIYTLKGLFQPRAAGSESAGGGLSGQWMMHQDEDILSQAGVDVSLVAHKAPLLFSNGVSRRAGFTQLAAEGSVQHSYFKQFNFTVSASVFAYDRNFDAVRRSGLLFDSREFATFAASRPISRPPRYALGLQFVRRANPPQEDLPPPNVHFFAGYSRIGYAADLGSAHSAVAGFDFGLPGGLQLDTSYNWFNPSDGGAENYYSVLLRLSR